MRHPHRVLPFLRAFESVARLGHVRSAAAELNLTPGAVSHQIKMLEEITGSELFNREKRRLKLSARGLVFRQGVAGIFRELDATLDAIKPSSAFQPEQSLSISASSGIGHIWLAPKLPEFADQLGLASIESHVAREVAQIDWRRTDLAVVYDNPPWAGCTWASLPELRLSPLCTPALLHAHPLRSLRDLRAHRLLHEDDGNEWQRWFSAAKLKEIPLKNAYFHRLSMAFNSALAGHGLALVSDFLAYQYLHLGQLVRPFEVSIPASKRYYVVALESRMTEPLIAKAFELMLTLGRAERIAQPLPTHADT